MYDSALTACPYCGETIELVLDAPEGSHAWVEDCWVCCRPIEVRLSVQPDGGVELRVAGEDEA